MEKTKSFKYHTQESNLGLSITDRRLAYVRQASYNQSQLQEPPHTPISIFPDESAKPFLSRSISNIDTISHHDKYFDKFSIFRALRSGNRQMKRLFLLISLNVAYSTAELAIGLFTGRVGMNFDFFFKFIYILTNFCFMRFRFGVWCISFDVRLWIVDVFDVCHGCFETKAWFCLYLRVMVIQVVSSHFVKIRIRNIELLIDKYLLSSVYMELYKELHSQCVRAFMVWILIIYGSHFTIYGFHSCWNVCIWM